MTRLTNFGTRVRQKGDEAAAATVRAQAGGELRAPGAALSAQLKRGFQRSGLRFAALLRAGLSGGGNGC